METQTRWRVTVTLNREDLPKVMEQDYLGAELLRVVKRNTRGFFVEVYQFDSVDPDEQTATAKYIGLRRDSPLQGTPLNPARLP